MAVEYTRSECGYEHVRLTTCPFCGKAFKKYAGLSRALHLADCPEADDAREVRYE